MTAASCIIYIAEPLEPALVNAVGIGRPPNMKLIKAAGTFLDDNYYM
jgi:hypothetical protein